jgi:transcriptional regulator with XRE-family HTH domain
VTIAAIERGRRRAPRLSTLGRIADALELDPSDRALSARVAQAASLAALEREEEQTTLESSEPDLVRHASAHPKPGGQGALPSPLTPLFGRYEDTDALAHTLASERLATLIGPGGVGKTVSPLLSPRRPLTSSRVGPTGWSSALSEIRSWYPRQF